MSRKIKFRAWVLKEGKMVQHRNRAPAVKMFAPDYAYTNKEVIVMQYTGLRDKNDVEIYEGDIVQTGWQGNEKGVVVFEGSTYCVDSGNGYMYFNHPESYEIIGNLYEHPHLIEEETE